MQPNLLTIEINFGSLLDGRIIIKVEDQASQYFCLTLHRKVASKLHQRFLNQLQMQGSTSPTPNKHDYHSLLK
jgi:hypothetical protein